MLLIRPASLLAKCVSISTHPHSEPARSTSGLTYQSVCIALHVLYIGTVNVILTTKMAAFRV